MNFVKSDSYENYKSRQRVIVGKTEEGNTREISHARTRKAGFPHRHADFSRRSRVSVAGQIDDDAVLKICKMRMALVPNARF
jgi:hypothetical protein